MEVDKKQWNQLMAGMQNTINMQEENLKAILKELRAIRLLLTEMATHQNPEREALKAPVLPPTLPRRRR